jgi:cation diffusion facilitator family transporter
MIGVFLHSYVNFFNFSFQLSAFFYFKSQVSSLILAFQAKTLYKSLSAGGYAVNQDQRHALGCRAVNMGLAWNILLAAVKTAVGILSHSSALLADGINSTSDAAYYIVVRIFMALSRKPPDPEHPYGHSQLESIAALVVGSFVVTTAVAIFWGAINSAFDIFVGATEQTGPGIVSLWVAGATIVIKLILTVMTRSIATRTQNPAVMALVYDHRNDALASLGASIGILFGRIGYAWADPIAAALVSLLVLRTGIQILRDSSANLMDAVPGPELEEQVRSIAGELPEIRSVEEMQAHRFGPYLVINVTIVIDGMRTVTASHELSSVFEHALKERIDFLRRVYVHVHPAE